MEDKYFYGIIALKERSLDMPMQKLELNWSEKTKDLHTALTVKKKKAMTDAEKKRY